jgi:uncharacterized membrane protein YebE (DUF533 family)
MKTKTLIYFAIIAGIVYYVYQRKKKQQEAQKAPGSKGDSTGSAEFKPEEFGYNPNRTPIEEFFKNP